MNYLKNPQWLLILFLLHLAPVVSLAQQKLGDLKFEPYVFETSDGQKVDAEFGRLLVPENRRDPRSRLIELAFVRFKSTSKNPGPPIIYLAGGPGGSGISTARGPRFPLFMAMREFGDVIALDPRGVGQSKPVLRCRDAWEFPLDVPADAAHLLRLTLEKERLCAQTLRQEGIDLSGYNNIESADDIEALRQALKVKKVSLWSISYGTFVALATIKRHSARIDRAILAGVEGLDDTYKLPSNIQSHLALIDRLVKADAKLSALITDFLGLVKTVLERLEKQPVTVEVTDPKTKQKIKVALGKFDLQYLTAQVLGDAQIIRALPLLYYAMSKGDFSTLAGQVLFLRKTFSRLYPAIAFTMDCSSGASPQRRVRINQEAKETLLGDAANFPFPEICAAWGSPDLGDSFRAPVNSKIPALFISGTLDGRTPPSNAEEVRKGFPRGAHLIVEGAAHDDDLFLSSPQIKSTMLAFMRGEKMEPTIKIMTTPPFEFRRP